MTNRVNPKGVLRVGRLFDSVVGADEGDAPGLRCNLGWFGAESGYWYEIGTETTVYDIKKLYLLCILGGCQVEKSPGSDIRHLIIGKGVSAVETE